MKPSAELRLLALAHPWEDYGGCGPGCVFCGEETCHRWANYSERHVCYDRAEALRLTRGMKNSQGDVIGER